MSASRFPTPIAARSAAPNPLERLTKEIRRRTAVVGILLLRASHIRLVGMVLAEQDDEWQDGRRYFRPETMTLVDAVVDHEDVNPTLSWRAHRTGDDDALLRHGLGLDPWGSHLT